MFTTGWPSQMHGTIERQLVWVVATGETTKKTPWDIDSTTLQRRLLNDQSLSQIKAGKLPRLRLAFPCSRITSEFHWVNKHIDESEKELNFAFLADTIVGIMRICALPNVDELTKLTDEVWLSPSQCVMPDKGYKSMIYPTIFFRSRESVECETENKHAMFSV